MWQAEALQEWIENGHRGIISVVTGGGKTVFALECVRSLSHPTILIVMPTRNLLDQWWEEAAAYLSLPLDAINIVGRSRGVRTGTVNLAVINTAARLSTLEQVPEVFLIVDECHRAATPEFQSILNIPNIATLGLSATPERQYDSGLADTLIPRLGPVIYEYTYEEALRDGVIVPFTLHNVIFELEPEVASNYDKLTIAVHRAADEFGFGSVETTRLLLKRARIQNQSLNRIRHTIKIVLAHRYERILVFFEDVKSAELASNILQEIGIASRVYHSGMGLRARAEVLAAYRSGEANVLISCRALDEGFNVPETNVGIIAAASATRRQRIQRLGRMLRPSVGKEHAVVFTLVATGPERRRLEEEETNMDGYAQIIWSKAEQ